MPQQGGTATNLLGTGPTHGFQSLLFPSSCLGWTGTAWMEMAVLRAMCPLALIRGRRHRGCEGDECGSSRLFVEWKKLDDSSGMEGGTIAQCAGGKLRHRETEAQWLHPGAGGRPRPTLWRAVPGWSGHSTSREGGRADGDRDNAENTPVALLLVTMARSIFSCCSLSDRTASPVQLLPHPTLRVAGPPWPPRAAPGAVDTVTLETKHKHLTRCHPRLSHGTACSPRPCLPLPPAHPQPQKQELVPPKPALLLLMGYCLSQGKAWGWLHLLPSQDFKRWGFVEKSLQGGITVPNPVTLGPPHCRESDPEQCPSCQHDPSPYPQTSGIESQPGTGRDRRSCFALCVKGQDGVLCLAPLSH